MDKILNYLQCGKEMFLKTLFLLTLSVVMINNVNATTDAWARPYEIKFNYEGTSSTNDAITIRKADGTAATIPEWKYSTRNDKFAYIKSQSNRKIQVSIDSNCDDMHLVINLKVTSGTGLGEVCNYFVANYDKKDWITLDLDGTIPSTVDIRTFTWEWEIYVLPDDISTYCAASTTTNTTHTYYTILNTPIAPMAEPWSSVLDYACDWAGGENTELSIFKDITEGAFNNLNKEYFGGHSHAFYPNFDLTGFFNEGWADCRDMSAVVQVFSNSIGITDAQVLRINGQFFYKSILPVGKTSWETGIWNFHQVAYLSNVFDACLKLNQSSPRIPVDEDVNLQYKSSLFDYGYWSPQTAGRYTNIY